MISHPQGESKEYVSTYVKSAKNVHALSPNIPLREYYGLYKGPDAVEAYVWLEKSGSLNSPQMGTLK